MAVIVFGVCVGSLIPDVDARNSTIFHRKISGMKGANGRIFNTFLAPVLPAFGYSTRYLIYLPAEKLLNLMLPKRYSFNPGHRHFTHSLIGMIIISGLTGLYISLASSAIGFSLGKLLPVFSGAYLLGEFIHLVQDSCSKSGIAWFQPFSDLKISGSIKTGENTLGSKILFFHLIGLTGASICFQVGAGAVIGLLLGSWAIFLVASGIKMK